MSKTAGKTTPRLLAWMAACLVSGAAAAADWPQFMRTSEHTGDAADEVLTLPLGLVAQVKLDDAVMTSPAVVGGLAYVVDQMGTAYCVDPKAGRIVWRVSPDGEKAMGFNTSSPCVAKGRMYYGTTAGTFHILDCRDGKVVKTIAVGMPIISSPTFANGAVYFQALDAVLRCLDLDGGEKWVWDHYQRYQEPPEVARKEEPRRGHPGSYDRPHYGGGEVAVAGTKVVSSAGWDIFCLEDKGTSADLVWCRRCPSGKDGAVPMSSSISGGWVYTAGLGVDGVSGLMRFALKDGASVREGVPGVAYPWITPAVRGSAVTTRNSSYGKDTIALFDCEAKRSLSRWSDEKAATAVISSHALARDHMAITTLDGELLVVPIGPKPGEQSLRIAMPNGRGIGSSPVVSGGCIYFGCDDGHLYVFGPGQTLQPKKDPALTVCERKSAIGSATGKAYGWLTNYGNAGNTCYVDDPGLAPPFKVRWAVRTYGHFKGPCLATEEGDVIAVTYQRTVACLEQATGRMRWRVRLPPKSPELPSADGLLVAGGRVYVPCPANKAEWAKMLCLDVKDGRVLWTASMGTRAPFSYMSPLLAGGKVAFASEQKGESPGAVIQAWDALTGAPAWQVEMDVAPRTGQKAGGCAEDNTFYYTTGGMWGGALTGNRKLGETVAIDAASGKVRWRTNEYWGNGYPVLAGGGKMLLYQPEKPRRLCCVSTKDGSLLWTSSAGERYMSIGQDYIAYRYYGGYGGKLRLEDGQAYPGLQKGGQLGGDTHACTPVTLTPNWSLAPTVAGLNVRDVRTGALVWRSPGFAPRTCAAVALANGRAFMPAAGSGVIFCWEPEGNQR